MTSRCTGCNVMRERIAVRRWALRVLVAWLFGIAAGVANACVLAQFVDDERPRASAAAHAEQGDGNHEQANCLDFCAKASLAAPKQGGGDDAAAAIPACGAVRLPVVERFAPAAAAEPRAASAAASGCPATAKRHDHGTERQAPSGASTLCPKGDTAAAAKTKSKPAHDHTRVHKTL